MASLEANETTFEAKGLTEGSEYFFKILAENSQGNSEPLESEAPVLIKGPHGSQTSV